MPFFQKYWHLYKYKNILLARASNSTVKIFKCIEISASNICSRKILELWADDYLQQNQTFSWIVRICHVICNDISSCALKTYSNVILLFMKLNWHFELFYLFILKLFVLVSTSIDWINRNLHLSQRLLQLLHNLIKLAAENPSVIFPT